MLKKSKLMENLEYHSYPNTFERQCTRHVFEAHLIEFDRFEDVFMAPPPGL